MKVYLNKLELHGFKSFPEKTVIKFHKGITTIIGPNGCGKSNIVDALLWVLGEQRIKNLRGENNEDLIFGGSASKKPLGMTEVGAYFSGESDETYIARRFFRTGEGKYILNEKYCRNRDIQDQLYKLNLGGRNYFIFEQGSIEKLVSLKPSERRLLIEEAAGISQYLVRKKETSNKLLIAQQNLDNLEVLTFDKEKRLKELKNQANYVSRYRTIKAENIENIKAYLLKKYSLFKSDLEEKKGFLERKISEEMILLKDISEAEKRYNDLEAKKWNLDQLLKKMQKDLYDLNRDLIFNKGEIEKLNQENLFLEKQKKENNELILSGKEELIKNRSTLKIIEDKVDKISEELKAAKIKNEKVFVIKNSLETEQKELSLNKEKINKDIYDIKSKISMFNSEIYEREKRLYKLENEIDSEKRSISSMNNEIDDNAIKEEEEKLIATEKELTDHEMTTQKLHVLLNEAKQRFEKTLFEIKEIKGEIEILKSQKQKYIQMKGKLSSENEKDYKNDFWLLQDLIKSDGKENNKIIENFYFDEINALIPKDIKHILTSRKNKFFILSKNSDKISERISSEDGFICFVKDLFSTENIELKRSLKDGVMVDNLSVGIEMFIKYGVPVVTKDAEVITTSGVVFKRRSVGVLDLIDEINEIEKRIDFLSSELTKKESIVHEYEKDFKSREADESEAVSRKEEIGKKLFQSRLTLKNYINVKENRTKRIETLSRTIEQKSNDLKKLSERLKELNKEKIGLQKKLEITEQKNEKLESDLEEKKKRYSDKEKDFWKAENLLNLIKEKKSGLDSEKRHMESDRLKTEAAISKYEEEIITFDDRIKEIQKIIAEKKEKRSSGSKRTEEFENSIKENEEILSEINSEIKTISEKLTIKREQLNKLKEEKSSCEIDLASVRKDVFSLEEISFKELNLELNGLEADKELLKLDVAELEDKSNQLKDRLTKMRDSNHLNFSAESEYELLEKDYGVLIAQKEDVEESILNMTEAIKKIDDESKESFMAAFKIVNENFKRNFQILFEGGEAELSLMDESDILETGLEIMAQPPGKRLQSLRLLSGGEKTLTSLAFLFALFEYKPSPFCVFDEVDASLDEANIQRFLKFLHKLKEKTQFLIITHNFKTMEEADYIYGISMNEPGISTIYSMKMNPESGFPSRK